LTSTGDLLRARATLRDRSGCGHAQALLARRDGLL
jgi:hypothetical protein